MFNYVVDLNLTHVFEWYVVRCDSKNGYQKDMFLNKIGLRVQIMLTSPNLIVNFIMGGTYMAI